MSQQVYTPCRICVAACGLEVTVEGDRVVRIAPDKANPYTWRDFCAKGRTAKELVEHPQRLRAPMKRVGARYVEATYDEALEDIAGRLNAIIDRHGPDAVGSYSGNPGGFIFSSMTFFTALLDAIGTKNRFWVGSIDQNNAHIVAERMYGSPLFSLVPEVDEARCMLLIGTNPAVSAMNWLENVPDGWRRIQAARQRGATVIVVDPRRSQTAEGADLHLAIRPGQDWALLLGLLKVIFDHGWEHRGACDELAGLDDVRHLAAEADLADLSLRCDIPVPVIEDVARRFATAPSGFCVTRTGVSQNRHGTLGEWLSLVLNHVTDRIDRPGGRRYERGIFPAATIFGKLAPPTDHRTRLRDQPAIVGYHALAELPDEITTPGQGQIRAMLISHGNPVVSGPDGAALDAALAELELLVAVDLVQRESHRHAHWLIPGVHWLEQNDFNPLFSGLQDQPYVQYGHRAVPPPPGVREEWRFFVDLALAMNRPLFGKRGVNAFVKGTRTASRLTGRPGLEFRPRWIERAMVASGRRVKWKDILDHPHGWIWGEKRYGDFAPALATSDKRVHASHPELVAAARVALAERPPAPPADFPLLLSNHRRHDAMNSWLNELPGLHRHNRGNDIEVHPADGERLGLRTGDMARLVSATGAVELPVRVSDAIRPGVVCVEHGWGSRVFDPAAGDEAWVAGANRNLLVNRTDLDPLSQTPAFNSTWVRLEPVLTGPGRREPEAIASAD